MLGYLDFDSTVRYCMHNFQSRHGLTLRRYGPVCQRASYLQLLVVFVHVESIRREKQAVQEMIGLMIDDSP